MAPSTHFPSYFLSEVWTVIAGAPSNSLCLTKEVPWKSLQIFRKMLILILNISSHHTSLFISKAKTLTKLLLFYIWIIMTAWPSVQNAPIKCLALKKKLLWLVYFFPHLLVTHVIFKFLLVISRVFVVYPTFIKLPQNLPDILFSLVKSIHLPVHWISAMPKAPGWVL